MKLRIEPLHRFSPNQTPPEKGDRQLFSNPVQVELNLNLEQQRRSNWCWAAVSSAIANHYSVTKNGENWTQEKVVLAMFGDPKISSQAQSNQLFSDSHFNQCTRLETVLERVSCLAAWSSARPPFRRLMRELDAGKPLAIAIGWNTGNHHYVLIDGYVRSQRLIHVQDPQVGAQQCCFDEFPKNYRSGGEWLETFWTKNCAI